MCFASLLIKCVTFFKSVTIIIQSKVTKSQIQVSLNVLNARSSFSYVSAFRPRPISLFYPDPLALSHGLPLKALGFYQRFSSWSVWAVGILLSCDVIWGWKATLKCAKTWGCHAQITRSDLFSRVFCKEKHGNPLEHH